MTLSTREADAAFADLICADPQLLRAEFDALISASFSEPPAPPRPAPHPAAITSAATGPEHGRQRSPPAPLPSRPPGRRPPGP